MASAIRWIYRKIARVIREDVKPWMADKWYLYSNGQCFGQSKKGDAAADAAAVSLAYKDIPIANWSTRDTISFVQNYK